MAQRKTDRPIPPEVRRFLSENGKKGAKIGGETTKRLIELGKQAAAESGENVAEEAAERSERSRRRAA